MCLFTYAKCAGGSFNMVIGHVAQEVAEGGVIGLERLTKPLDIPPTDE